MAREEQLAVIKMEHEGLNEGFSCRDRKKVMNLRGICGGRSGVTWTQLGCVGNRKGVKDKDQVMMLIDKEKGWC